MLATLKKKFGNMKAILPKSKDPPGSASKLKETDNIKSKAMLSSTQQGPTSSS
jgi:hypothetical protein